MTSTSDEIPPRTDVARFRSKKFFSRFCARSCFHFIRNCLGLPNQFASNDSLVPDWYNYKPWGFSIRPLNTANSASPINIHGRYLDCTYSPLFSVEKEVNFYTFYIFRSHTRISFWMARIWIIIVFVNVEFSFLQRFEFVSSCLSICQFGLGCWALPAKNLLLIWGFDQCASVPIASVLDIILLLESDSSQIDPSQAQYYGF